MGNWTFSMPSELCPVYSADWPLLVYWEGHYFVDLVLPFDGT